MICTLPPSSLNFRDYFKQYGNCEAIYHSSFTRGGLVTYTVVLQFRESSSANRVKQK